MLKSALEKVIFFECRLAQLESEKAQLHLECESLKSDLAQAAEREVALKQQLATADVEAVRIIRERSESTHRAEVAAADRDRLLDKLIEAEQLRRIGEPSEGPDLAGFIAEMRAEILELRARTSGLPSRPPDVADPSGALRDWRSPLDAGDEFAREGRLGVSEEDREGLTASARFESHSEKTLFALSLRELSSADEPVRLRAAKRLQTTGAKQGLPALAAALTAETTLSVRCALLDALASAGDPAMLPIIEPMLHADPVELRLAALEAAFRLQKPGVLDKALDDPSPLVRRRAAVLASGRSDTLGVLELAMADRDASVRRVAALSLGESHGESCRNALLSALDDSELSVRRAAAKGLSRSMGPEVFAIADLDQVRRRREIRRLLPSGAPRSV